MTLPEKAGPDHLLHVFQNVFFGFAHGTGQGFQSADRFLAQGLAVGFEPADLLQGTNTAADQAAAAQQTGQGGNGRDRHGHGTGYQKVKHHAGKQQHQPEEGKNTAAHDLQHTARGEIVGLAGVDGNGQTELVEILTGLRKAESGEVKLLGKDVFNATPKATFDAGISSIPADRQKHGLVLEFSNEDNMILQHFEEEPFSKNFILVT